MLVAEAVVAVALPELVSVPAVVYNSETRHLVANRPRCLDLQLQELAQLKFVV